MFEVDVNGRKQRYRSKPTMNVDTTGSSGDVSIPKPLTYDYMPEGYPSKSVQTVTLMEEQEVAFSEIGSNMRARTAALDIESGDKLTIIWDGVSYNVTVKTPDGVPSGVLAFGNLGLAGAGDTEDYPFMGAAQSDYVIWYTADTAASHTIKVMRQQATYTPMSKQFMPSDYPNEARVTEMMNTALGVIENGSY